MSKVRFQLDEHVPHAVAEALLRRGIDVTTPSDAGLLGAPDEAYLAHASDTERVVVTSDHDFLRLHRELPHAGIAFAAQQERTIGQIVAGLVLIHEALEASEMAGRVEFL